MAPIRCRRRIRRGRQPVDKSPPEWDQGVEGFGKRFGSDFAIAAIGTTTRYGLAEAFKEDTLYYRCECSGPFPRLRHAVISTFTGRRRRETAIASSPSLRSPPLCGLHGCSLCMVSGSLRGKRRVSNGQLQSAGITWAVTSPLEFLYRGPHVVDVAYASEQCARLAGSRPESMSDRGYAPVAASATLRFQ